MRKLKLKKVETDQSLPCLLLGSQENILKSNVFTRRTNSSVTGYTNTEPAWLDDLLALSHLSDVMVLERACIYGKVVHRKKKFTKEIISRVFKNASHTHKIEFESLFFSKFIKLYELMNSRILLCFKIRDSLIWEKKGDVPLGWCISNLWGLFEPHIYVSSQEITTPAPRGVGIEGP